MTSSGPSAACPASTARTPRASPPSSSLRRGAIDRSARRGDRSRTAPRPAPLGRAARTSPHPTSTRHALRRRDGSGTSAVRARPPRSLGRAGVRGRRRHARWAECRRRRRRRPTARRGRPTASALRRAGRDRSRGGSARGGRRAAWVARDAAEWPGLLDRAVVRGGAGWAGGHRGTAPRRLRNVSMRLAGARGSRGRTRRRRLVPPGGPGLSGLQRVAFITIVHGRHDHLERQFWGLASQPCRPDLVVVVAMDDTVSSPWSGGLRRGTHCAARGRRPRSTGWTVDCRSQPHATSA